MTPELDATDLRILRALQKDGSASMRDIADRVGLTQAPCWRRIDRMRELGVIKERVFVVDRQKLGFDFVAFVRVKVKSYREEDLRKFEEMATAMPEIQELQLLSSESAYRLRVVTRSVAAYEEFFRNRLASLPFVNSIETSIVVSEPKYSMTLPI